MKNKSRDQKLKMVDWYNPSQLVDTGIKTAISTIIGENADPRLVGMPPPPGQFFDYSRELVESGRDFEPTDEIRNEIWIDYVSDVGDGWNSTYSVAYSLARRQLGLPGGNSSERGQILIFGGDGVYPTANPDQYENRLTRPYRLAFNASRTEETAAGKTADLKRNPHVFALPGNHDWYDSLVAFQKIFCTHILNDRIFAGGWRARQKRSYFALKLPHKWWLLGVDLQLSHNIDVPQLEYFESVIDKMKPADKVILCVPEPYWVKAIKYADFPDAFDKFFEKEQSLERLEATLKEKGIEIKVYLAGDLHHYRRFQSEDGRRIQKITAGGGGAFLHPTHDFDFNKKFKGREKTAKNFTLKEQYPSPKVSRRQDWKNLYGFLWNNKTFGVVTAVLYPLLALLIHGEIHDEFHWTKLFKATVNRLIEEPISSLIVILLLAGLIFFTDSNSKLQKYLGGLLHGFFHLGAAFVLGWAGFFLMLWSLGIDTAGYDAFHNDHPTRTNLVWFGWILLVGGVGGYVIGSFIMGAYLFISLHFWGRHDNEAFSALKIEDYKNFLRLHIDAAGRLTIYPFKIEQVGREWTDVKDGAEIVACRPKGEIKPELIETIDPLE